jgi:GDP-L-fucose synthase
MLLAFAAPYQLSELARLVADVVGYAGGLVFDSSFPDGMPRKLFDVSRLAALGWRSRTSLRDRLGRTYAAFLADHQHAH